MSKASKLIERCEQETGQRIDAPESDAMTMLFGALVRMTDDSPRSNLRQKDDFAIGVLAKHQMSEEGQRETQVNKMLVNILSVGILPDDLKSLF